MTGYFVDRDIERIALGRLVAGDNEIVLEVPFGKRATLEAAYLLGDFAVRLHGSRAQIVAPDLALDWGDISQQGLPFYGGSLRYGFDVETDGRPLRIGLRRYRGPLVRVFVDGTQRGYIAYAPYQLEIDGLEAGRHRIELELPGNNHNSFAPMHRVDTEFSWVGPPAWYPNRAHRTATYNLRPFGILDAPLLDLRED